MKSSNNDPWIWTQKNTLSEEFCNSVIKKFESDPENHHVGTVFSGVDTQVKRSTDLFITIKDNWKKEHDVLHKTLISSFEKYSHHITKYFRSKKVDQIFDFLIPSESPQFFSSGQQLQRTKPNEFYTWHHDSLCCQQYYRVFTYIFYLNDIKVGGETQFMTGERIRPETGKILIFPSTQTYMHRGVSPSSGVKYISVGWMCKLNDDLYKGIPDQINVLSQQSNSVS